ncbi:uncharacterized protein LY79DRAFT_668118 [Colletotrichum navitas]|uniref:Uncharacterized protein n=1 Tax=Colletotrichum navitas TaxID=681940 RepID=A0AAD8Q4I2_9PEZI|nr:uncharacterized protein LY79DRAFT_668118 [Colletotrichum navitas]KAK1595333.1 hypothetical protein LY79DRAFT_668118 [Colletotrichum navitas]
MPLRSGDGRVLTWDKMCTEFIQKIILAVPASPPVSTNDCWFFPGAASNNTGYPVKKLAARGEGNK